MSIDRALIGKTFSPITMTVDPGRLRFFAKAIGETDPVYTDIEAAKAAGHPNLPVPPTFLFGIEMEAPDPFAFLNMLGTDLRFVLHGEQSFTYRRLVYAGDTITATPRISDIYSKKGGALEFAVKDTELTRDDGEVVATMTSTLVIRNPGAAK
jgi:acyl dehydratase